MATYTTLKRGKQGDDVRTLQQALKDAGYTLDVDGIYGRQTQAAVTAYQKAQGLTADGIAGTQTQARLYGASQATPGQSVSNAVDGRPQFTGSEALSQLAATLKQTEANRPADYTSPYQSQIDTLLDTLLGRKPFSYDFATDPIYLQARDTAVTEGRLAMEDTMGQAAALTGGYGSSYATTAASQAYQAYLRGVNDLIPSLAQVAYSRYQGEGDTLAGQLAALQAQEQAAYARHRDAWDSYYTALNYDYGRYADQYDRDYDRYVTDLAAWQEDRAFAYQKAQAAAKAARSGGSSGGKSSAKAAATSTGKSAEYDAIYAQARRTQGHSGVTLAYNYLYAMAEQGRITAEEAGEMLAKMGIDRRTVEYFRG